jgi:hypothetical protein
LEHDEDEIADMREVLRAPGQLLPLIVNYRTSPPIVLGGNKRLQAMLAENWKVVAVLPVDLDEGQAKALAVELNATQGQKWNGQKLLANLQGVSKGLLGERRDALFAELAEAQKLISEVRCGHERSDRPRQKTTCPACGHEW